MKTTTKVILLTTISLLLSVSANLFAALPDVLSQMPADATVIVATQPINQLTTKINAFAQQIGLPMEQDIDPIGTLSPMMGLQADIIDSTRGLGVAITNIMDPENSTVVYVPISNAEALTQYFLNSGTAGKHLTLEGIWTSATDEIYFKPSGTHLLISGNPQILATIDQQPKGVKLSALDTALFSRSEAAATVNLAALMPMIEPMLKASVAQAAQATDPQAAQTLQSPAADKLMNMAVDRLTELQGFSLGLRLGDAGINLSSNAQAQPGTALATFLSNHPTTDLSELAGLPDGAAYAFAMKMNGKSLIPAFNAVLDILAADPELSAKIGPDNLTQFRQIMTEMYDSAISGGVGYYPAIASTTPGAAGAEPAGPLPMARLMGYYEFPNAERIMELYPKSCTMMTDIAKGFGYNLPITYQKNAAQVGGKSYDQATWDFSQLPLPDEAKEGFKMAWAGNLSFTTQFGLIDKNRIAVTMNPKDYEQLVQFAGSGQPGLDQNANFAQVAKNLHPKANIIEIVDLGKAMQMSMGAMQGNPMAMMMGMFQGTLGGSALLENGVCQMEVFIPIELVQSVTSMATMMMGGMMAPPPGAEPQQPPQTF